MSVIASVAMGASVALGGLGCTTSAKDVREARQSGYMTDFAVVYGAALAATRERYPNVNESAQRQLIATAWHPLSLSTGTVADGQSNLSAGQTNAQGVSAAQRTRYFVRFRVYVVGGKPFRIRIEGEASEWRAGEVPAPLKGAEIPPWLGARTDSLRVSIHKRLKEHAVKLKAAAPARRKAAGVPLKDNKSFGEVPAAAGGVIARVSQAAEGRNVEALRPHVAADVTWAAGSRGADSALAIWAADSTKLTALADAVSAGCAESGTEVVCPKVALADPRGFVARFRTVAGAWKLVSFYEE